MKNDKLINFKKKLVLKSLKNSPQREELEKQEKTSNSPELILKNVELYEPLTYEDILKTNKKKYRNLKIDRLLCHLDEAKTHLFYAIDLYKELKNRTEFWEGKTPLEFNFTDWNVIKKTNGRLAKYFKELIEVRRKIERSKNEN